jgi:putative acyl-CoA dehydrogenase
MFACDGSRDRAVSRVHQFAKVCLFTATSACFSCPLAMTDGAAKLCELLLRGGETGNGLVARIYERLTSSDADTFWTSGQWMTERTGGSDLSGSETVATPIDGRGPSMYALHGYKFFTSATLSECAFTLARVGDDARLSLFAVRVERRGDGNGYRGIRVAKLKDKAGTTALPTAELELDGCEAVLLGARGRGIPLIANLFNLTRIWTAVCSAGSFGYALATARDYARRRRAFGKLLQDHALHTGTLARIEATYRGALVLCFESVRLMGIAEQQQQQQDSDEALCLRILTPLCKMSVSRHAYFGIADCIELLGGTGYMRDATLLPSLLAGQQANVLWEGTANVLSLDVLRVAAKSPHAFVALFAWLRADDMLPSSVAALSSQRAAIAAALDTLEARLASVRNATAKLYSFALAAAVGAALLYRHAAGAANASAHHFDHALTLWTATHLADSMHALSLGVDASRDRALAMSKL